jgi:hypothetical protein
MTGLCKLPYSKKYQLNKIFQEYNLQVLSIHLELQTNNSIQIFVDFLPNATLMNKLLKQQDFAEMFKNHLISDIKRLYPRAFLPEIQFIE